MMTFLIPIYEVDFKGFSKMPVLAVTHIGRSMH
jgi:hypothetical protein